RRPDRRRGVRAGRGRQRGHVSRWPHREPEGRRHLEQLDAVRELRSATRPRPAHRGRLRERREERRRDRLGIHCDEAMTVSSTGGGSVIISSDDVLRPGATRVDTELNVSRLRDDARKLATPKEYAALMMIWGGLGDDMPGSVRKSPPGYVQDVAASSGVSAEQLYAIEAMLAKGYTNLIPILEADPALLPSPPVGVTLARADGIVRPRKRRARRSR